jgi:tetratricopeptide (TPR) repeat protein
MTERQAARMTPHEATEQGLKLHQAGRLEDAQSYYAAAVQDWPDYHPALHLMGLLRMELQDHGGALAALDDAAAAAPADYPRLAVLHASRGEALMALARNEESLAALDQALARDPAIAAAWNSRGLTLNGLGRPEEALASFSRALAIDPGDPATLINRAATLTGLGRIDQAIADYTEALVRNPNLPQALFGRSHLL